MPTRTRRSRSRTRSPFSYSGFAGSGWGRTGSKKGGKKKSVTTVPAGYKNVSNSFQNKITSFRTLFAQTKGPAKSGRPSPATLNSFANWINKGAIVQTVTCAQVVRWGKNMNTKTYSSREVTANSCKTVLCKKFGKSAIKAVARSKSGSFIVATTPTLKGRNFTFPH